MHIDLAEDRFEAETSRIYRHVACGGLTMANGKTYEFICDPLVPLVQIECERCQDEIKLRELVWNDTGESLADYRRRLRETLPAWLRLWAMGMGFGIGGTLGAAIVFALQTIYGHGKAPFFAFPAIAFFFVGFIVHITGAPILRSILKIKTPRLR